MTSSSKPAWATLPLLVLFPALQCTYLFKPATASCLLNPGHNLHEAQTKVKLEISHKGNYWVLTEFLCGESEPLALLAFCASDVPNLRASYTGSTLFPQALEENIIRYVKMVSKQMCSFYPSQVSLLFFYKTTNFKQ